MPRGLNEADPMPWQVIDRAIIGRDRTKRRRDGEIDQRCNNCTTHIARVLIDGPEGAAMARTIVSTLNRTEGIS